MMNEHSTSQAVTLQLPSTSEPVTAATSVQTLLQEEEKPSMRSAGNEGVDVAEQGVASSELNGGQNGTNQSTRVQTPVPQAPQVFLTFLLVSGRRRTMSFDPDTTVGRVKELIWNAWPTDWSEEQQPPAPSYIRILYLGKILQDDDTLTKLNFVVSTPPDAVTPTIVHLSIRPYAPPSEDDAQLKKKSRLGTSRRVSRIPPAGAPGSDPPRAADPSSDDANAGGCCGCVIC